MLMTRNQRLAMMFSLLVTVAATPSTAQHNQAPPIIARYGASNVPTALASGEGTKAARVNNWTVGIAAGLLEGSFIRFASELAKALDDGDNLRILPIVTYGASENISDLLYLRGVDIAITHADAFEVYKKSGEARNIEQRINYISQMHNTDFYVLARPEITSVEDLAGKKVGFHVKGSGPSVTGPMVFERLGVAVEPVFINHALALEKMEDGEIAAIFQLGAKPNELLAKVKPDAGFHFVQLHWSSKFADYYLPDSLSHDDYPNLVPAGETVETLAVPVVLAVYNWPKQSDRFRRVERFIHAYFEHFDKLTQPSFHPQWKEINLAARVPGWNRYWAAEDILAEVTGHQAVASGTPAGRSDADPTAPSNAALYQEFLEWRQKQKNRNQ